MDVFQYPDYRAFINAWIDAEAERGARIRLAEAAHCSPSWITRVLADTVKLTPDQAMGIAQLFHLNDDETDAFLLLVEVERAATPALKKRLQRKLDQLRRESRHLKTSLKSESTVSAAHSAEYYSSWIYAAIHVACMIKPLSAAEVAASLQVSPASTAATLRALREMGLVEAKENRFVATSKGVHLPAGHVSANLAHVIWRNRTIQHLQAGRQDGLHYSGVHCLSRQDIEKIHDVLKGTVLQCRKVINDSPSEELAVFCLDWYALE